MNQPGLISVAQLTRYVKSLLEEQRQLKDLLVRGEICDLYYRSASGHLYFPSGRGKPAAVRHVQPVCRSAEKVAGGGQRRCGPGNGEPL